MCLVGKRRTARFCLTFVLACLVLVGAGGSESRVIASDESSNPCSQPNAEREELMRTAEKMRFTVRRVEFIGTTYTRDEVLRRRMTNFQEGDVFSRRGLINSLRNMSKLRSEIYPVTLSDVELNLNKSDQTVDLTICFKPKRR